MRFITRRLNLMVLPALLAMGLSSCARHGIVTVETSNSVAKGVLIGDASPVREGALETIRLVDLSPGVIHWGLGYGTTQGVGTPMGETAFIAGHVFDQSGTSAPEARFVGPFAAGIAPGQQPAARYRSAPAFRSTPVSDLLSDLAAAYDKPVLVVGKVQFERLQTDGGFDGQVPAQNLRNTEALFIAIVARSEDVLNQTSRRVFHIPEDMQGLVDDLMIARAAILTTSNRNWRTAGARMGDEIQQVVPVDPFQSRISVGEVDVYLIDSLTQP